jgi:drug/metabolite transporter (DMT)-like permease
MNSYGNKKTELIAYLALGAVCVIWGTTYLALRVGVTQFPPFLFSALRFLAAGPILMGFMLTFGKASLPSRTAIFHQAIAGILMITMGVGVVGWAEMYVSSGLAAIICSVMPVYVVLINIVASPEERPTFPIVLGLAVGTAGIILIFGEHLADFSNVQYRWGITLTFLASLNWAFGSVWIKKKNHDSNPFVNAGLQMLFGGIFLIPLSLLFDDYSAIHWSGEMFGALTYLIMVGSVAAYACYSYAIKNLPVTLVSLYAYVNPIVAVVLGWLLLSEKLNLRIILAIGVTIAGIYIVNRGYQLRTIWKEQLQRFKI